MNQCDYPAVTQCRHRLWISVSKARLSKPTTSSMKVLPPSKLPRIFIIAKNNQLRSWPRIYLFFLLDEIGGSLCICSISLWFHTESSPHFALVSQFELDICTWWCGVVWLQTVTHSSFCHPRTAKRGALWLWEELKIQTLFSQVSQCADLIVQSLTLGQEQFAGIQSFSLCVIDWDKLQ